MNQLTLVPPGVRRTTVCALLTCFNRREKTLECLRALQASVGLQAVQLRAVLVDDGSSDGTADAVEAEFDWVQVLRSRDTLFWCRGMHLAFETAMQSGHDHYLWLNDDTVLAPDAMLRLLACFENLRRRTANPVIVVGSTLDPVTGVHTYGGARQATRANAFKFVRVAPSDRAQQCDTLTGNIVLISAQAAKRVGNLDAEFEHAMGDTDYGLRARKLGVELWTAPHSHGTCAENPTTQTYKDITLPLRLRWKRMLHRKGLPWRSWLIFTRRHTGVMWPLYFAWPYAKLVLGRPLEGIRHRGTQDTSSGSSASTASGKK